MLGLFRLTNSGCAHFLFDRVPRAIAACMRLATSFSQHATPSLNRRMVVDHCVGVGCCPRCEELPPGVAAVIWPGISLVTRILPYTSPYLFRCSDQFSAKP